TLVSIMFLFSDPQFYIQSFTESDDSLILNICSKSKKCGVININNENITYQYSLGLKGKKGIMGLRDAVLGYNKEILFIKIKNGKNVISVKCNRGIYEKIKIYFDNKLKMREDTGVKSKRDIFWGD
ncbi:MAG: hypothetical protein LBB21_00915, partial [Holosporaceae bacterium]|nr:hypothetical protein [Holosporaceae bacterium]